MYVRQSDEISKKEVLHYLGGQHCFQCDCHKTLLTIDVVRSGFMCSITVLGRKCSKKSLYRCPESGCSAAVCREHFSKLCSDTPVFVPEAITTEQNNACPTSSSNTNGNESPSVLSEMLSSQSSTRLHLITDAGLQDETPNLVTDSGIKPIDVTAGSKATSAPLHVLLNGFCHVKQSVQYPYKPGRKFSRFFQNVAAKFHASSVPLFQPEGNLFPSIFWKQNNDGAFVGAIPFHLLDNRTNNKRFGFHGLEEHMHLRVKGHSLLTSSSSNYVNFAFDCVLNLKLHKHHTDELFKRGVQNLIINNNHVTTFPANTSNMKFDQADTRLNVNQLAAAMATETPHLFVTITANFKQTPGLSRLYCSIDSMFDTAEKELKSAAVQACMVIGLRIWEYFVELLLEYLQRSDEHILGKILKIWARAEFQTTEGNYPHYHILLWIENVDDIDKIIQCSEKFFAQEFYDMFRCSFGLINSLEEVSQVLNDCMKILTHNCDKGKQHCMRVRQGKKTCRFPPQPQSHCNWYETFKIDHSDAAFQVMKKIDLAVEDDNFKFGMKETKHMESGKFKYAATKGEHLSPTSAKLFALTRSSSNVLRISKRMAERYLHKYAAGKEEHALVKLQPDNSFDNVKAVSEGIVNFKITGVKIMDKDKPGFSCYKIAQTECAFVLLEMPYVMTNIDFVSVPTTPLEYRGRQI